MSQTGEGVESAATASAADGGEKPGPGEAAAGGGGAGTAADEPREVAMALSKLTQPQATAIVAIVRGAKLSDAAREAGVDRATLYRWRTADPQFVAALNAWRSEQQAYARDRLLTAANLATDAVVRTLEKGDGRLGLRVLKELGCAETGTTDPVDPLDLMTRDLPPEEKVEVDKEVAEVLGWLRQTNSPPKHFARIIRIGANVLYRIVIGELREADFPTGWPRFDVPKDDPRHWAANMPPLDRSDYVPGCDPLI